MNVSYRWLRDLAPGFSLDPAALAEHLASLGAPVEELRHLADGLEGIQVARVLEVRRHPDADRLSLCTVDGGEGELQVVCGAPVVKPGAWYPFAPVGSTLPGGLNIRKAKIRGEVSNGMLCSERELGLGRDQAGIMELTGASFTPGLPLVEALGLDDWRLDVEVTANRPDLLSHLGVAREVAPGGDAGLVLPPIPGRDGGAPAPLALLSSGASAAASGIQVTIHDPELCARYLGAVIRGVRVGPSPPWLAARLRAAGARPINNVVDATNYVLLELGHPLHAFDLARVDGGEVHVRKARQGEILRTLDGEDRALTRGMLVICDARRPIALAGIMGGEDSEVGPGTTDLLLECALFRRQSVRATRRALGMTTDASYRFERGVDPEGAERALGRAVEVILAVAGGRVEGPVADAHPTPWSRTRLTLRPGRVERILGVPFSRAELRERLEPLGFVLTGEDADALHVEVPGFRGEDVTREIDLIEEVARTHGYDRFPEELGPQRPGTVPDDPLFRLEDRLRDLLATHGFLEAVTLAFAPAHEGEVAVQNPLTAEESRLRSSLLPGLLRRVAYNFARGARDIRLFELGTVFHRGEPGGLPREEVRVVAALTGGRAPAHWSGAQEPVDLWEVKGLTERLVRAMGLEPGVVLEPGVPTGSPFATHMGLTLRGEEGEVWGVAGQVAPGVVDSPPWAGAVWAVELTLPAAPGDRPPPRFRPLPLHPGVERDLAFVVPGHLAAGDLLAVIHGAGGDLLQEVGLFDLFQGEGIPPGHRSLAFRLRFRAPDRTLVDAEVAQGVEAVVAAVREAFAVEPRGR